LVIQVVRMLVELLLAIGLVVTLLVVTSDP